MHARLGPRALPRLVVLLVCAVVATLGTVPSPGVAASSAETSVVAHQRAGLLARIQRLGIVDRVREMPGRAPNGTRFFRIWFRLPVDHDHPDGRQFRLRGTLLHRGTDRPMVLETSGYGVRTWGYPYPDEIVGIVRGNQLDLEHRFFEPSRPARPNWQKQLTIRQAAADQHLVVRALQHVYHRPWLSTGISKGGMTMTYHRRFYPRDVAGTVAFVAPNDAVDSDDAYAEFQADVGGPAYADCRAALVAVQRRILEERDWFVDRLARRVRGQHAHLTLVGGPDRGVEIVAVELYFSFWQYQEAAYACDDVPTASASRERVWSWADEVLGWSFVTDENIRYYVPYYYQAATQLGSPQPYEDEVADLLRYPGHDSTPTFVPDRLEPLSFDPTAMADVDRWVRRKASRMLFVYGELDPWSAEQFSCGAHGVERRCATSVVPGGNHGAAIYELPPADRRAAIARIRHWAGLATDRAAITAAEHRSRPVAHRPVRSRGVPSGP